MAEERPGLLAMAGALIRQPFERAMLEEAATRNERLAVEASNRALTEIVRRVEPEEDGWLPVGGTGKRHMDELEELSLREAAQKAAGENPHAIGYLKSLKRFVLGKGPQVHIEHESADVKQAADEWFAAFHRWNNWDRLEDEIAERAWRDGETFVRRFDEPPASEVTSAVASLLARKDTSAEDLTADAEKPPDGMVFLRLVPPEHIADPTGEVTHGIVTAKDDVATVLGYCHSCGGKNVEEVIPADQVRHIKVGVDSDVKRGRSILGPYLKPAKQFQEWLNYRIILNLMRTAVVLVKTINGNPTQIQAIRDTQEKARTDPTSDRKLKMLKPGTTVHASTGVSYEFKSPNINAPDAKDDGRAILLTMAAMSGLPEYMFTGDASNANFASTMVAESPAVREFELWQDAFTPDWQHIHRWALVAGAKAGAIKGLTEEEARTTPIAVEWPPLLARDVEKHALANKVRLDAGVLSREGFARDEGINYEVESARLKRESEEPVPLPVEAALKQIVAAVTAGALTPDAELEARVRIMLGIPALVGEAPPLDTTPLPTLPPQDLPTRAAPSNGKVQVEVTVGAAQTRPAPQRVVIESFQRDEEGVATGAVLQLNAPPARVRKEVAIEGLEHDEHGQLTGVTLAIAEVADDAPEAE